MSVLSIVTEINIQYSAGQLKLYSLLNMLCTTHKHIGEGKDSSCDISSVGLWIPFTCGNCIVATISSD